MKFMNALIILFLAANLVYSQSPVIKVQNAFQGNSQKPQPATFTFTKSIGGAESFLIDAGLGLNFDINSTTSFSAFGEYHRNSLVSKIQNTLLAGFALETLINHDYPKHDLNFAANYNNNLIDKTEAVQLTGEYTILFYDESKLNTFYPNVVCHIGNVLKLEYYPSIGFECESRFQCKNDSAKGNIIRALGKCKLVLYPDSSFINLKLEYFCNFEYRYDAVNSTQYSDFSHAYLQTGINYTIWKGEDKASVKISGSYSKGSNPLISLKEQEFYTISLLVQI